MVLQKVFMYIVYGLGTAIFSQYKETFSLLVVHLRLIIIIIIKYSCGFYFHDNRSFTHLIMSVEQ